MPFLRGTLLLFAIVAIAVVVLAATGAVLFVRRRLLSLAFAVLGGLGFSAPEPIASVPACSDPPTPK